MILQKFRKFKLYIKLSKWIFNAAEINFLGFVVNQTEIVMELSKIDSIATWPIPCTFREIQVFLGFANFYWHFINGFSHIASSLWNMLKSGVKSKFNNKDFAMTAKALEVFNELKKHFTIVLMLVHYKLERQITFETDASVFTISEIISQLIKTLGQ